MFIENYNLKQFNTFGISAKAHYFAAFGSTDTLVQLLLKARAYAEPLFILGGGSNILLTQDLNAIVLKNEILGITVEPTATPDTFLVTAGAGEIWHNLVLFTVDKGLHGLENLSLIPGSVGAAPMQNIGAYGVEIKDTFYCLQALNLETLQEETFSLEQCEFGYRESVFKRALKGKYVITKVSFLLKTTANLKLDYGSIKDELKTMGVDNPTLKEVSNAVINIRNSKLPNPAQLGNAGSFFKNPVVSKALVDSIAEKYPNVVSYPAGENQYKLAAGWLIEQAGLKGFVKDHCGIHSKQALVLVNYGGASGKEILDLSNYVAQTVKEKFGVTLEKEVNII
ncbi:MAG: UDP-N-acetylmuramate dehydrogenase [Luteibaculaceae bacterium]